MEKLRFVGLAAELGDLRRFRKATELMGYLGLVPSEHSSGDSKRQGRITRRGNGHARRIMVEGAWAYRHRPAVTRRIRERSDEASPAVKAFAWKAQERLCTRYRKLQAKGKSKQRTIVAIARELPYAARLKFLSRPNGWSR